MAKIIAFGKFNKVRSQVHFKDKLQAEIEEVEKRLHIPEDEPLLVLTDANALTIGNCLLDARNEINRVLEILGIDESEVLPDE